MMALATREQLALMDDIQNFGWKVWMWMVGDADDDKLHSWMGI
jgi:hypothetical protein